MNRKLQGVLLWGIRILLALGFLLASLGKLSSNPQVIEMFNQWQYPKGFHMLIGILELSGAILLCIPKLSRYAAMGLLVIMLGALVTHFLHDPIREVIRPIIFMLLLGGLWYLDAAVRSKKTAN